MTDMGTSLINGRVNEMWKILCINGSFNGNIIYKRGFPSATLYQRVLISNSFRPNVEVSMFIFSLNGGFLKWGYPYINTFHGIFHCKPSSHWGTTIYRRPPNQFRSSCLLYTSNQVLDFEPEVSHKTAS